MNNKLMQKRPRFAFLILYTFIGINFFFCGLAFIDPPTCFPNQKVSHNVVTLNVNVNNIFSFQDSNFDLFTNPCNQGEYQITMGSDSNVAQEVYIDFISWDTTNCNNQLCSVSITATQCGITLPYCRNITQLQETGTIDANGDINTFTEISSPTFRVVPVR